MVSKDTIITEFINQYPEHVHILTEAGFPCVGCFLADGETIEMGCLEAGIDVYDLIDTINAAIDNSQNEDKKEDTPNFTSGIKE
jgi:hybrid cluster-associated redox disulfide protein